MSELHRPFPVADERSAPFWLAAVEHRLVLPQCPACRTITFPPDLVCSGCGVEMTEPEHVPASGRGVVRSWTTVHRSFVPGFDDDLPFVLVDVELADQPDLRMIGRLVDGPDAPLSAGAPVTVAFEDLAEGIAVPAFVLDETR